MARHRKPDSTGLPASSPGSSPAARILRAIIPALIILSWLAAAAVGGPYFGRVSEVSTNDSSAYLPTTAESTQVQERLPDFLGSEAIPAVVVITSPQELTEEQLEELNEVAATLGDLDVVAGQASPAIPSEDSRAVQIFIPLDSALEVTDSVDELRAELTEQLPPDLSGYVTGPAGFLGSLVEAFGGIDSLLLLVAVGAVFIILIIVYRSPILPVVVLLTSTAALSASLLVVWYLAKAGVIMLSGQTQGILFILVIGATTDYCLLYVARYREALRDHDSAWAATKEAWRGTLPPVAASGSTVIAGLLCLLLSELASNRDLGPIASIGIVFAMLAGLSLLPMALLVIGRRAYWPRVPRVLEDPSAEAHLPTSGVWARLPSFVERRHRPVWIVVTLVLLAGCVGIPQLKADGVPESDLVLGANEARDGQEALAEHFPGGSGSPLYVLAEEADLQSVADVLLDSENIEAVSVSADSPSGTAPVTSGGIQGFSGPPPEPVVSQGQVLLQATLAVTADSSQAGETVTAVRTDLQAADLDALVGGVSATDVDSNAASIRDRNLIIPIVLVVILGILMILLRAVLAPVMLIATVVLSFAATMGISALVFNHIFDMPGADPAVPLYGFVFLVALGIDYNIFLMTRIREEALLHGTTAGIGRGLAITGGVITSAGMVLAATFAALSVIPILFLLQVAFIVAFGVLIDTIIVRSVLVPALSHELTRHLWWPSTIGHLPRAQ